SPPSGRPALASKPSETCWRTTPSASCGSAPAPGALPMPDDRVDAAIRHWAARFIANGIDYNDFGAATASIDRLDQRLDAWTSTAVAHARMAEVAREQGRSQTAGEAWLRAAVSYHFSKFVWVVDPELNRRNTREAVRALYAAHALLDPTAQRIEAPLG